MSTILSYFVLFCLLFGILWLAFLFFLWLRCGDPYRRIMTHIVDSLFSGTVKILIWTGRTFCLSYNEVNIIVWYMLLPLLWTAILDFRLHQILLAPAWLLLCAGVVCHRRFGRLCDRLFVLSQRFILLFGDYYLWSVIICLLLPVLITAGLLLLPVGK